MAKPRETWWKLSVSVPVFQRFSGLTDSKGPTYTWSAHVREFATIARDVAFITLLTLTFMLQHDINKQVKQISQHTLNILYV